MPIIRNQDPGIWGGMDCLFHVYKEKIPENGEDSYCYCIREDSLLLGVFDGCGGSGAKRYVNYCEKTGAYIGARAVAGAVKTWFENSDISASVPYNAQALQESAQSAMRICKDNSGQQGSTKLRGSIAKEFPTTAAIACCASRNNVVSIDCYWAGDSRVYLLDEDGLAQITQDDLDDLDAFENISGDGVLTNVISAGKTFRIHGARLFPRKPFLVFTATDGCFGYIPTPMEFESFFIEHLLKCKSIAEFESSLYSGLERIAGDDYSLVGAVFGFGTFQDLQKSLKPRFQFLSQQYILPLNNASPEIQSQLWDSYKGNYYRYLAYQKQQPNSQQPQTIASDDV